MAVSLRKITVVMVLVLSMREHQKARRGVAGHGWTGQHHSHRLVETEGSEGLSATLQV